MKKIEALVVAVTNKAAIIKIHNNFFQAHIRNNLMREQNLLVGDKVIVQFKDNQERVIVKILLRKNQLYRPKISNVDQVLIVNALDQPTFNTIILNKLLTLFNFYQIEAILVFTKLDLISESHSVWKKIKYYQENLKYDCYFVSNKNEIDEGIKKLSLIFKNKISLLTGVTGVGKSSLLNSLEPKLNLVTNEFSIILNHGKHTTTTTKLYFLMNGIIADSPGFLVLKLQGLSKFDIAANFPVIKNFINKCKFRNCLHLSEPDCAVIENIQDNKLISYFYQDYCKILLEFDQIETRKEK